MVKLLRHIISAKDFSYLTLLEIFRNTQTIKEIYKDEKRRQALEYVLLKNGKPLRFRILTSAPSTRTISSFEDAIEALGGSSKLQLLEFSSIAKGETYWSAARILGPRTDCIIIRDDRNEHAAQEMQEAMSAYNLQTVIINAGSGDREHPTQMLVDLYTIWEHNQEKFESGDNTYAFVGDLRHSRTIHSLLISLAFFGGTIYLIGPAEEEIPGWVLRETAGSKIKIKKIADPLAVASKIDYWYFTRLQDNLRPEGVNQAQKTEYIKKYGASEELRKIMKEKATVLHPLPHGKEYQEGLDCIDPRFIHYQQADNGFYVRMALLKMIFAPIADFRNIIGENETIEVSGYLESLEIPIRLINAICIMSECARVRIDRNEWVKTAIETKERLIKPKVFCPECRPI